MYSSDECSAVSDFDQKSDFFGSVLEKRSTDLTLTNAGSGLPPFVCKCSRWMLLPFPRIGCLWTGQSEHSDFDLNASVQWIQMS